MFSPSNASSDEEPVHMANTVKNYGTEELIEYLRKKNLKLDDEDFAILRKEKITGLAFLEQTKEDFHNYGLKGGPATVLANVITDLKKSNTSKSNTGLVSVFMDNSNILIEGKYIAGYKENAGSFDYYRDSYIINQLHLDHGRLLSTVLRGRKMGSDPVIVGSRPPPSDEIWSQARNLGFIVNVFDRNCENKEKMVDTSLVAEGIVVCTLKNPGTLVLIAGDGDYGPLIDKALLFNWKVEIWFWSSGISGYLRSKGTFYCLDNYYKYFTYALGPCPEKNFVEITDGETIKNWRDGKILDCYVSLRLFGWWHKEEDIIYMYFDDKAHLNDAKKWFEDKYSDSIRVWVRERKRKNSVKK